MAFSRPINNDVGTRLRQERNKTQLRQEDNKTLKVLCPRKDFYRLAFPEDELTSARWQWRSKYRQQLQYEVTIPEKRPYQLTYIYVKRSNKALISELKNGAYGRCKFVDKDEEPTQMKNNRRYREFIIRYVPKDDDEERIKSLLGDKACDIHHLRRFKTKNKEPSHSILMVWKNENEKPPATIKLYPGLSNEDSPWLPLHEIEPRLPKCFKCKTLGHIAKYCKNQRGPPHQDFGATTNSNHEEEETASGRMQPSANAWSTRKEKRGLTNDCRCKDEIKELKRSAQESKEKYEELKRYVQTIEEKLQSLSSSEVTQEVTLHDIGIYEEKEKEINLNNANGECSSAEHEVHENVMSEDNDIASSNAHDECSIAEHELSDIVGTAGVTADNEEGEIMSKNDNDKESVNDAVIESDGNPIAEKNRENNENESLVM